jgi:hypothetical protein
MILRGERERQKIFHIVARGLGVSCVIYIFGFRWPWALWGLRIYIGLAVGALILKVLILVQGRWAKEEDDHGIWRMDNGSICDGMNR